MVITAPAIKDEQHSANVQQLDNNLVTDNKLVVDDVKSHYSLPHLGVPLISVDSEPIVLIKTRKCVRMAIMDVLKPYLIARRGKPRPRQRN